MDEFDRRLEIELKDLLDPIVDTRVPRRRGLVTLRALSGGLSDTEPLERTVVAEPAPAVAPVATPV